MIVYLTRMTTTPNLPTEMWDIIFDYKNAMETKDKHKEKMTDSLGYIKYDMEGAQDGEYVAGEEVEE